MNNIRFTLEDNSYHIEISKEPNPNSLSKYSQYICHIKFLNSINYPVQDIVTNEKGLLDFIVTLAELQYTGDYYDNIVYFNPNTFIYIAILPPYLDTSPTDEDDDKVHFQVFQDTYQGRKVTIIFKLSFIEIEDIIYHISKILEDIPYISEIDHTNILADIKELFANLYRVQW